MGGASDAEQIVLRLSSLDFAWDIERALEFALFRTFAVPSISGLLHKTGTFRNETRKRYDDTEILISEVVENGFESDRAHRPFPASTRCMRHTAFLMAICFMCSRHSFLNPFGG